MPNLIGQATVPGQAGVVGESSGFNGVLGVTTADGHAGVAGVCDASNGNGVYGRSKQANGVIGYSSSDGAAGVAGANDDGKGNGVYGRSKQAHGVLGESNEWVGVCGVSRSVSGGSGVRGEHATGAGVHGVSTSGVAVYGSSPAGVGVRGEGQVAGQFLGDVDISGNLTVQGIAIQRIVALEQEYAALRARVPYVFNDIIVSGGLAALGGWIRVTIARDGTIRWQGHAHDSGADGYDFGISAIVRTPSGLSIALAHSGHVGGTFTSGSRDYDWDISSSNDLVAKNYEQFVNGQLQSNLEYSSDIGSALEKTVGWLIKFTVGTVVGPLGGAIIFVGVEVGSLITTGSLVPGARIVGNILWLAGPENTLFALAAEGIASIGGRTREVEIEWYNWANMEVFAGALPPRELLVLTDTIGPDNRAFTFPRFDGKITLNMGPSAFDDPRLYNLNANRRPEKYPPPQPGVVFGEIFIHELVHACQIHHASMGLELLADALSSKVCEATGGDPYLYGMSGPDYSTYNLEQQAQIVSDWFAGAVQKDSNQTGNAKDPLSPYYRYIIDNVVIGRL